MSYDGFISYSHAADDLLAPRLQAGLQRFAKPWWKRRALRVFRDESSLAANPHLWTSITEALDSSEWFVLLLSPDAARSEWVNEEIAYWVANRDPSRILPVLTDGSFRWGDGDVTGDAVPDALHGVFTEEPRWVDLRFAKGEEQLDLSNPSFSAAVADVASAMHGIPKDELESEEVRQFRRTTRTAWAAGLLLLILTFVSIWVSVLSSRNAAEARLAVEAESQARLEADLARALADSSAEEARLQTELAVEQAERADRTSRRLIEAALERNWFEVDPPGRSVASFTSSRVDLPLLAAPPDSTRLDFLQDHRVRSQELGSLIVRLPGFIDADRGLRTGDNAPYTTSSDTWFFASAWLAEAPFHIRHGFPLPVGMDAESFHSRGVRTLQLYIKREVGPADEWLDTGVTYLFHPESLIVEESAACGPNYREQAEPVQCLRWVFEFPEGLPAGRYDLWLEWLAPCGDWVETPDVCPFGSLQVSLFEFGTTIAFVSEDFLVVSNNAVDWPFDPWELADPIPDWEGA